MSKCKFIKKCPWYRRGNRTCEKDGGAYYSPDRPAGCWFRMEKMRVCDKK